MSKEVETKTQLKWHFSPISAKIRREVFSADEDVGKGALSHFLAGTQAPDSKLMLRGLAIAINIKNIHTF